MQCVFRLSRTHATKTVVSRSIVARGTLARPPTYLAFNQTAWKHAAAAAAATPAETFDETVTKATTGSEAASSASSASITDTATDAATTPIAEFRWDDIVEEAVEAVQITSAVIPWSELSFLQKLFYPYTYSVMHYLDFLAEYMPWWGAILGVSVTMKILFLPLTVYQQKLAIRVNNIQPQFQKIQLEMNESMMAGDAYRSTLMRTKLFTLLKEHEVTLGQRLWPPLVQTPMFMTYFFLLRRLSEELPELQNGGALWFTNLSVPDPLLVLPLATCMSLILMLELGISSESAPTSTVQSMKPAFRWLVRTLPIGMFYLIYQFPAATLLYWTSSNFLSLVFCIIFKVPAVQTLLKMPKKLDHKPEDLPLSSQSISSQLKRARDMSNCSRTTMELRRLDDVAFRKAGVGPLKKTYDKPPTPADTKS